MNSWHIFQNPIQLLPPLGKLEEVEFLAPWVVLAQHLEVFLSQHVSCRIIDILWESIPSGTEESVPLAKLKQVISHIYLFQYLEHFLEHWIISEHPVNENTFTNLCYVKVHFGTRFDSNNSRVVFIRLILPVRTTINIEPNIFLKNQPSEGTSKCPKAG